MNTVILLRPLLYPLSPMDSSCLAIPAGEILPVITELADRVIVDYQGKKIALFAEDYKPGN